jgi:hypothetical protein
MDCGRKDICRLLVLLCCRYYKLSSLSPTHAHSLKTLHKSHLKLNTLKCVRCFLKLNKTRHVSVNYLTIFRGYLYSALYSYYTNTCMFLLYTGYVAIFYLFMCACIVPACAVFGCVHPNTAQAGTMQAHINR